MSILNLILQLHSKLLKPRTQLSRRYAYSNVENSPVLYSKICVHIKLRRQHNINEYNKNNITGFSGSKDTSVLPFRSTSK